MVSMVFVLAMCLFGHSDVMADTLDTVPLYTEEATFSKSGVKVSVPRFYASRDKKKAFVLLKFNASELVSTDAKNWSGYLTDADMEGNPNGLRGVPSGSIYFFGSTGYAGVYLVNDTGFQVQALQLTLRNNAEIEATASDESSSGNVLSEEEYDRFDQADIIFNPAASGAEVLPCIDSEEAPTPYDMYLQSVTVYEEAALRQQIDQMLATMKTDLNSIAEYENRLANDGVIVPEEPVVLSDDDVVSNADGTLTLSSDYLFPGGYSYDWRSGSVTDGYLDALKESVGLGSSTDEAFFSYMSSLENNGEAEAVSQQDYAWIFTDGSSVESLNTGSSSARYSRLQSEIGDLVEAWNKYIQDKEQYQVDLLGQLLQLEADAKGAVAGTTVNSTSIENR